MSYVHERNRSIFIRVSVNRSKIMKNTSWGGVRSGSGRTKQNLHISLSSAQALTLLLQFEKQQEPELTPDTLVERLIEAAYQHRAQQDFLPALSESQK